MHEYSLVEALVRRVETEATRRGALQIHSLTVSVGELAGVDPELFRTAYETFRAGTLCEKTELRLVQHPAAWTCPKCQRPIAKGAVLSCPDCQVPAKLDANSDALLLESIDHTLNCYPSRACIMSSIERGSRNETKTAS